MLLNHRVIAAILAAAICQPAAAAIQPLELEPSTAWTLNYNPERCSLMREFGTGDSKVHLEIISFGYWNGFQVLLTGPAIHRTTSVAGTAKVRLGGDTEESEETTFQGNAGKFGAILFALSFSPFGDRQAVDRMSEQERENQWSAILRPRPDYDATVDSISIRPENGPAFVMKSGDMGQPLAALRTCVDELVKSWGGDPELQKTLSRIAKPREMAVIGVQGDYPEKMLDNGINGFVPVRVSVDAAGNASGCTIQVENVNKSFAQAVCKNLTGNKFEPARDKQGNPVPTIYETRVIYRIAE